MARLTAIDALGRGIANVRGNPQLVALSTAGSLALVALLLASVAPWLAALEVDPAFFVPGASEPGAGLAAMRQLAGSGELMTRWGGLILSLLIGSTVASVVFCWYYGGLLGVLAAGDAQAPAGRGREPLLFRTFSLPLFVRESTRLTWRLLSFYSLMVGLLLALVVLLGLVVGLAAMWSSRSGGLAGLALGCGGLLPIGFALLALIAATELGQADLVRPDSGTLAAARAGFEILGRRLGGATALICLVVVASFAASLFFAGMGGVVESRLAGRTAALWTSRSALVLGNIAASAMLNIIATGAFVALFRSERAADPEATHS